MGEFGSKGRAISALDNPNGSWKDVLKKEKTKTHASKNKKGTH